MSFPECIDVSHIRCGISTDAMAEMEMKKLEAPIGPNNTESQDMKSFCAVDLVRLT